LVIVYFVKHLPGDDTIPGTEELDVDLVREREKFIHYRYVQMMSTVDMYR
jgi:hypothetical protein